MKKRIKLAFIGQKGIPATFGGIEYYVESIIEKLPKDEYDITVYTRPWYTDKDITEYKGVKIRNIPSIYSKFTDTFTHVLFCSIDCCFRDFDIVHYQGIGPSFFCILPKLFGKKIVLTIHGLPQRSGKWNIFAKAFLQLAEYLGLIFAHRIIAVSNELKSYIENKYKKEVYLISNAINPKELTVSSEIIESKYGLSRKKYIVYLGRITPEKRIEWIIQAFNELCVEKNDLFVNLRLVITGFSHMNDPYERKIRKLAGTNNKIDVINYVKGDEKRELLCNSLMFLLPSYLEGLPTALLEAMSYKLPSIVSDIPSNKEVINDGVNGYFFDKDRYETFKDKIVEVLVKDNNELEMAGEKARKFIIKNYSLESKITMLSSLYEMLLARGLKKICFVCSSGGHLFQLYLIKEFWEKYERFWVTFDKLDAKTLLKGEKIYYAHFPTTRNIKSLFINFWRAIIILRKEKPDIVISTGAGVAVPFFIIGKLLNAKLVYMEVVDRIKTPTLTGKLVYYISDELLLQWDSQKEFYPKGKVIGHII